MRARFKQPRSLCPRHRQRPLVGALEWHNVVQLASLGGVLTSSPAATSPSSGAIDVFVRGTDNALWERTTTNGGGSWGAWTSIGGQIASGTGPAACSWVQSPRRLCQGTNGALYQKT